MKLTRIKRGKVRCMEQNNDKCRRGEEYKGEEEEGKPSRRRRKKHSRKNEWMRNANDSWEKKHLCWHSAKIHITLFNYILFLENIEINANRFSRAPRHNRSQYGVGARARSLTPLHTHTAHNTIRESKSSEFHWTASNSYKLNWMFSLNIGHLFCSYLSDFHGQEQSARMNRSEPTSQSNRLRQKKVNKTFMK